MKKIGLNLTALCVAVVAAAPMTAQESTGQIRGTVRDRQGNPIADATVEISGPALLQKRVIRTNERGEYRAPLLPPGPGYSIVASKTGFITSSANNIHVGLGQTTNNNFSLRTTSTSEATVEIVGNSAIQDKSVVQSQQTTDSAKLEQLPLATRSLENISQLAPGVSTNASGYPTIRGGMALETKYLLNGTDISDNLRGMWNSRNYFVDDAIAETQVITSPVSVRYGGTSAGMVNAITKTGGNEFSGSIRLDLDSPAWTAKRPFGPYRPYGVQDTLGAGNIQTSASDIMNRSWSVFISGPIIKDRLWFATSTKLNPPTISGTNTRLTNPGRTRYDTYYNYPTIGDWIGEGEKEHPDNYGQPNNPIGLIPLYGISAPFYVGSAPSALFPTVASTQFYDLKLTGAITPVHTITVSASNNKQATTNRLYGNSCDPSTLQLQLDKFEYISAHYTGIINSFTTLEVSYSKKQQTHGGGGDPVKGHRIFAADDAYNFWRYNNGTFSAATPDRRDITTHSANVNFMDLDSGIFGRHNVEVGAEYIIRERAAANTQSPTKITISTQGTYLDASGTQRFYLDRHDPLAEDYDHPDYLEYLWNDKDPDWFTWASLEFADDSPTTTKVYALYAGDNIAFGDKFNVYLGLRYDRVDFADTFGNPKIKTTNLSPRFQVTYDVFGDQKYLAKAHWARYTATLTEGATNRFSVAGNPPTEYYTIKKGMARPDYTMDELRFLTWDDIVNNRTIFDVSPEGMLYLVNSGVSAVPSPDLKAPANEELSLNLRYNSPGGSYVSVTYSERTGYNLIDDRMTVSADTQVESGSVLFPELFMPVPMEYYFNNSDLKRDYKSLEVDFNGQIKNNFSIGGNYTYAVLKGNGGTDGDTIFPTSNLNYYADIQEAMGHGVDMYAPYGYL
ncbi:MAG: TonB-dependent receptor, partial [Holophagales bacterium]|nr:TonB-dependent receptor [Holophagales bacterium]